MYPKTTLVKQLTHSVFFNHWSINKLTLIIPHKIANTNCLIYSLVNIYLVKYLAQIVCLNHWSITNFAPNLFYKVAKKSCIT